MDVARTFDALRASARSGQTFPRWWCLSDPTEQEQARAYCQAYIPFFRSDTWGSTLTRQVLRFILPQPKSEHVTEASCNAIGFALLDQLGQGWTAKRTGIADKEFRLPYYMDMMSAELIVLDGVHTLLQGKTEPRLRRREVLFLQNLFYRPSYERPESTGITRVLGNKQGLSIPVIALADDSMCHLLAQMEIALTPEEAEQTSLLPSEQINEYGPPAGAGTLSFQDLNQVRAYLRLPQLDEATIQFQAYSTDRDGEPAFGIARWEGTPVFFKVIEHSVDETGNAVRPPRYVLLEATPAQLEESIQRQHHLHPMEIKQNAALGWFQRDAERRNELMPVQ